MVETTIITKNTHFKINTFLTVSTKIEPIIIEYHNWIIKLKAAFAAPWRPLEGAIDPFGGKTMLADSQWWPHLKITACVVLFFFFFSPPGCSGSSWLPSSNCSRTTRRRSAKSPRATWRSSCASTPSEEGERQRRRHMRCLNLPTKLTSTLVTVFQQPLFCCDFKKKKKVVRSSCFFGYSLAGLNAAQRHKVSNFQYKRDSPV